METDLYGNLNFPETVHIDLTGHKDVKVKYDNVVYKLNLEKLLKEFGEIVEITYDEKSEQSAVTE